MKKAKLFTLSILAASCMVLPPIAALTSCSQTDSRSIPVDMLDIQNNILYGLKNYDSGEQIAKYNTLTIPANVIAIAPEAFSIKAPNNSDSDVKYVGVFSKVFNSSIKNLVFEKDSKLTHIGEHAFDGCDAFNCPLSLPNLLQTLSEGCFAKCSYFVGDINLPEKVINVGVSAFEGCDGFTGAIKLPAHLKTLGAKAFKGCSHIGYKKTVETDTSIVTMPVGITKIAASAFEDCAYITKVVLNKNTTEINEAAFKNCKLLNFVGYSDSNPQTGLVLNDSVQILGKEAFKDAGLFEINLNAFQDKTAIPAGWAGNGETGEDVFAFYQRKPGDATLNSGWTNTATKTVWSAYCLKNGCTTAPSHNLTNDDLKIAPDGAILSLKDEVMNKITQWEEDVSLTINLDSSKHNGIDDNFLSDAKDGVSKINIDKITKVTVNFVAPGAKAPIFWSIPQFFNLPKLKTLELIGSENAFIRVPNFVEISEKKGFHIKPYHDTLTTLTLQNVQVLNGAFTSDDGSSSFTALHEINNYAGTDESHVCVTQVTTDAFKGAGATNNLIVRGSENIVFVDDTITGESVPCKSPFAGSYITSSFTFNPANTYVPESCFEDCKFLTQVTFPNKVGNVKYLARNNAFKGVGGGKKPDSEFITITSFNGINNLTFTDDKQEQSATVFDSSTITSMTPLKIDADIPESTFKNAKIYNNVAFGEKCTKIGASAFEDTTINSPFTLTIPSTITTIGDNAFLRSTFAKFDFTGFENKEVPPGFSSTKAFAFAIKYLPADEDQWWTLRFGTKSENWKTYLKDAVEK